MRRNKKGGNTYLSVNNDTNAYTRYGAPGNCSGPNWKYASVKGGKNKRSTKMLRKSRTKLKGGYLCSSSPSQQKNCLMNSKSDIGTRVSVLSPDRREGNIVDYYNMYDGGPTHFVKYDNGDDKDYVMADKNYDVISYGMEKVRIFKEAEQKWLEKKEKLTRARERVDNLKAQLTEEQRVNLELQEARELADERLHPKSTYVAKYDDYRNVGEILLDVKNAAEVSGPAMRAIEEVLRKYDLPDQGDIDTNTYQAAKTLKVNLFKTDWQEREEIRRHNRVNELEAQLKALLSPKDAAEVEIFEKAASSTAAAAEALRRELRKAEDEETEAKMEKDDAEDDLKSAEEEIEREKRERRERGKRERQKEIDRYRDAEWLLYN